MDNKNLYYDSTEGDNLYKYEDNQLNLDSATPEDVIEDWVYRDPVTREVQVGTMPIINENRIRLEPDGEYHIPKGYHPGTEVVYVGSLSDFTYGTATPEDVIEGKIFWVNGERLVGTRDEGPTDQSATATSDDIREGKTAWVNKTKVIGNLPSSPRKDMSLTAGSSYTIPRGIESGDSVISAIDLATQTQGTATSDHIFKDEIAWVNGVKVIGEYDIDTYVQDYLSETDANQEDVRSSKKFYSSSVGRVSNGSMTEYLNQPTKNILNGQTYAIPKGYHDGNGTVVANSLESQTQGTATENNLSNGVTAWVNGQKITGNGTDVNNSYNNGYNAGYSAGKGQVETRTVSATCGNFGNINTYGYSRSVAVTVPQIEGKSLITYAIQSISISNTNREFGSGTFQTTLSGNTLYVYSADCGWKSGGTSVSATVIFIYA